jgi:Fur family ferric uptake transcriptional regulator
MEAQFIQTLKNNKLKITRARIAVFSALSKSTTPQDALHIHRDSNLFAEKPIDLVTVYRILQSYLALRLIRQIEIGEGKYRYELASLPHHHHAVCLNCNRITDINMCNIQSIENTISARLNFEVTAHDMELFGYCSSCRTVV